MITENVGKNHSWGTGVCVLMARGNVKRKQSKICTTIIIFSLLLLAVLVFVKSMSLMEQKEELLVQAAELTAQIEDAEEEYAELEEKEEYMKTKKYVEDVARNQLGLVYPDEIVIRPEE